MRTEVAILALALIAQAGLAQPPARPAAPKPAAPQAAQSSQPAGPAKLQDRIVAVVNEDPILESEIDRAIILGLQQPKEGENERAFRRRVLDTLIEDRLRLHEIDRFGFMQVAVEDVDEYLAEIRSRFATEEEYQSALQKAGISQRALRQLVARQLMTLTFVEERLGPRVFVSLEDINEYYRNTLTPEMQRRSQAVPPIEDVREDIRVVLKEQKLTREIQSWTTTLRKNANVNVYFDRPLDRPLPPLVERVTKKGETRKQ